MRELIFNISRVSRVSYLSYQYMIHNINAKLIINNIYDKLIMILITPPVLKIKREYRYFINLQICA